ncbi:MAG: replication/maintenance protein RepL [Bacteroidaceae bacterium]|nr:replication/maintenance protein RepL [Bacteroidaceae bacterium]
MAKKDSVTKEQTVRYETWVNPETGEAREFAVVDKPYQSDYNFHKVWLNDLAKVMGILGGAKIQVFSWILGEINPFSNEVSFNTAEAMKAAKVGRNTVLETVQLLIKANFMKKIRSCVYRINPKMLVKGSHNRRVGIMLKYDELQERQMSLPLELSENWEDDHNA